MPAMENKHRAHPCHFRLVRTLDRGWGEMAFEYHWDSTSGLKGKDGQTNPDLDACTLYEYTTYPRSAAFRAADLPPAIQNIHGAMVNQGRHDSSWYHPPDPPFAAWKFRDPTDGRTAPVALGCFSAINGWAWDRHKTAGRFLLPEHAARHEYDTSPEQQDFKQEDLEPVFVIAAMQEYRFHCSVCGMDAVVPGSHSGPHAILRCFGPRRLLLTAHPPLPTPHMQRETSSSACLLNIKQNTPVTASDVWRYSFHKHQASAYLDIDGRGYVDDSAHIGFGP